MFSLAIFASVSLSCTIHCTLENGIINKGKCSTLLVDILANGHDGFNKINKWRKFSLVDQFELLQKEQN